MPKLAAAVIVALIGGGAGGWFIARALDDEDDGFTQAAGEVFLEPAESLGPDPFSASPLAPPPKPAHKRARPASLAANAAATPAATSGADAAATTTPSSAPAQTISQTGTTPGLFGGSNDTAVCDAAGIATFLKANPDKAAAWVKGINADPNLFLPAGFAGTGVTVDNLDAYLATLTPLILRSDTRVTNNGFKNGQPTPRQSVLQTGTAVLVDDTGVPRVKCMCGNPLSPPRPTNEAPKFTGGTADFPNPTNPTVIFPGDPVRSFTVCDEADPSADCATVDKPTTTSGCANTADPFSCLEDPEKPGGNTSANLGGVPPPPDPAATPTEDPAGATAVPTEPSPTETETPPPATPTAAPTPTFAPAQPVVSDLCSPSDEAAETTFTLENSSSQPVQLVWHNFDCSPEQFAVLAPGDTLTQGTFVGHIWSVAALDGTILQTFAADSATGNVVVN